jgi:sugar lactone lactonase YvrE
LQVNNSVSIATLAFFADASTPQALAIGDSLTVAIGFTLQTPLGSNPLRIAVLNSDGSQTTSNTSTNPSSNIYSGYKGFMAAFNPNTATAKPTIYRRNGIAGEATYASLINALTSGGTAIWTSFADSGASSSGLIVDNPYQAVLTVVRTSASALSVSFQIHDLAASGSPTVPAYSITGTSSTGNTTAFDTVVMHAGSTATGSFTLSNVTVVHTPAPPPVVAVPAFNPPAGTYAGPQSITITSPTVGAAIRFTTDGTNPTSSSGTLYTEPIVITGDTTFKAIAFADGMTNSPVASASYNIEPLSVVATPTFSPDAGTYTGAQSVTIATATLNATLRYTTDGTVPTASHGQLYSAPVVISADTVLKAMAYANGMADSVVATASYTIFEPPPVPPTITEPLKSDHAVTVGRDVQLRASINGFPPPAVVWQVSTDRGETWRNLSDNSTYRGTATTTLTIVAATTALDGMHYRFVATNATGSATSGALVLAVIPAPFLRPTAIAVDTAGNLYVGDEASNTVKMIDASGTVHDLAGATGLGGAADGVGSAARFFHPGGLAWSGVLFVADSGNSTIRCVLSGRTVMTLAGTAGVNKFQDSGSGDVWFNAPAGVAISSTDQIYVADAFNHMIRRVTLGGTVTTFAGSAGCPGADDGVGSAAKFRAPAGIAVGSNGIIYVADTENHTLRKITHSGSVSTLAGLPLTAGSSDGTGNGALFSQPRGLAVDEAGNVYVADTANSTIRKVTPSGVVTTFAGLAGMAGFADGTGAHALFNLPRGLALDDNGNLYVADTGNAAIRKITPVGEVTTLVLTLAPSVPGSSGVSEVRAGDGARADAANGGGGALSEAFFAVLAAIVVLRGAQRRCVSRPRTR